MVATASIDLTGDIPLAPISPVGKWSDVLRSQTSIARARHRRGSVQCFVDVRGTNETLSPGHILFCPELPLIPRARHFWGLSLYELLKEIISADHTIFQISVSLTTTLQPRFCPTCCYMSRRSKPKNRLQQLSEQIAKMSGEDIAPRFETLQLHAGKLAGGYLVATGRAANRLREDMLIIHLVQARSPTLQPSLAPFPSMLRLPTRSMTRHTAPVCSGSRSSETSTAAS